MFSSEIFAYSHQAKNGLGPGMDQGLVWYLNIVEKKAAKTFCSTQD